MSQTQVDRDDIREILISFLERSNIPYPQVSYDEKFEALCYEDATRRGLDWRAVHPYITGGISITRTTYIHLPNIKTQIWIAIYTGLAIYIDDRVSKDFSLVEEFNERFRENKPQLDQNLDVFASVLHEARKHFGRMEADMIVAATLGFVTGTLIENHTENMAISKDASRYSRFVRDLTGDAVAYGIFSFPRTVHISTYLQALPDIADYYSFANDVFSFYKEEMNGETRNYVSVLADSLGVSKSEALRRVVDELVEIDRRVLRILAPCKDALEAYAHIRQGYVGFHAVLPRYRLNELDL